jgi:hypothetical protein
MMRMRLEFPETQVTVPMVTTWKIENGKWFWYRDPQAAWLTPMGPSDPSAIRTKPVDSKGRLNLSQEEIAARAQSILQQSAFDKNELKLSANRVSSDQVVFHNGQPGQIKLTLMTGTLPAGVTAKLDKSDLNAGENAVLKVSYEPPLDGPKPTGVNLQLVMAPFNKVFSVMVKFDTGN